MARVFIGNLPIDIRESEVEDLVKKYGRIRQIDLKIPARPPAFAFVEFEDYRDAEDACRAKDGTEFDGARIRVEIAKGRRDDRGGDRGGYGDRGGRGGDRGGYGDRGGGGYGDRPRPGPREGDIPLHSKTGYRVFVKGVPESCSWQDLKDHFRCVGNPAFTNVYRTGRDSCCGVVEFDNRDDMERAVKDLDDSEFRNRYDTTRVNVLEDKGDVDQVVYGRGGGGGGRSRSRSRSPRRSRSRSPDAPDPDPPDAPDLDPPDAPDLDHQELLLPVDPLPPDAPDLDLPVDPLPPDALLAQEENLLPLLTRRDDVMMTRYNIL